MFRKWGFFLSRRSLSTRRGIKIAHFFSSSSFRCFALFCPPPKKKLHHALWILNSNHYAHTHESRSSATDIAECEMLVMALYDFRLLRLRRPIRRTSPQQQQTQSKRIKSKTKYFHYVLQNITHSVFAQFAKCRFRSGCERIFSFSRPRRSSGKLFGICCCCLVGHFFISTASIAAAGFFSCVLWTLRCCTSSRTNLREAKFFSFRATNSIRH